MFDAWCCAVFCQSSVKLSKYVSFVLLGIKWYQFVRNDDVRRLTKQPKLTAIIQSCRLTLFGHIMRMDDSADAQEDPVSIPSSRLEKTTRSSPHHVAQHRPTGSETPSYASRSSRFGSEPPSVEDDVDVWHYAIVSCIPETMTTSEAIACCPKRSKEPGLTQMRQYQKWSDALFPAVITVTTVALISFHHLLQTMHLRYLFKLFSNFSYPLKYFLNLSYRVLFDLLLAPLAI